jgi:spermidine synthase
MMSPDDLPEASCSEEAGVRYLHLGDTPWVQGCMRVRKPTAIELEYVQRMLAWLLWHEASDAAALQQLHTVQLGLGAASLTKFCTQELGCDNAAVELNPQVIAICSSWFALAPETPRSRVLCGDALDWVQDPHNANTVDALMVDVYDHEAAGPVLDSAAFYRACRSVLKDGGLVSINLFGRTQNFAQSLATLQQVFGRDQVWHFMPTREGNAVVLAGKGVALPAAELLQARCVQLRSLWGWKTNTWLKALKTA